MIKRLPAKELDLGMITLEAIKTPHGQYIAPAGVELTRKIINRIKLYGIDTVLVDVRENVITQISIEEIRKPEPIPVIAPKPVVTPVSVPVPAPTPVPVTASAPASTTPKTAHTQPVLRSERELLQNTRIAEMKPNSQVVVKSPEFLTFQVDYLQVTNVLKETFVNVAKNKDYQIDETHLVNVVSNLYASRNTITELFDMIYQMRSIDDSIYSHCVNVALISRMIGRWLHLDTQELNVLTCCGLFHDIGKIAIPDCILNKPGRLSDEEFNTIKSHPKIGYELLRNQNIDIRIKQSALMHHERYDGSGYPNQLANDLLIDYAAIVAIADVYDAMTAARSYREPLCPFQVIANFEQEGFQKYHTKYLLVFLNRIATTYQNNRVLLNDGRACKIVMLNQNYLSKPMVQFDDGTCMDLASQKDLYINKVL